MVSIGLLALLLILLGSFVLPKSPKLYFWIHQKELQTLVEQILPEQKLRSLKMGFEGSYESQGQKKNYDDYRSLNGELVTHYGPTDRKTNPAQIKYNIDDYLTSQQISKDLYFSIRARLQSLKLEGFFVDDNRNQINFLYSRDNDVQFFDLIYTTKSTPEAYGPGPAALELAPNWFFMEIIP